MNSENFKPHYGVKDKIGKQQCFERRVLNVSIDYLNVVLRLTKSGTVTDLLLLGLLSLIFGGWI